jgi:SAM dependent carboxyl methyltransferase
VVEIPLRPVSKLALKPKISNRLAAYLAKKKGDIQMPNEPTPSHGVMEGGGAYNKYAKLPAGGAALALPLLGRAVPKVELDTGNQPVVIADYGSSQGKNSLIPMQVAIRILRNRLGPNRPISVFHIDQASNDFNSLFEVLDADPDRYVLHDPNVFPSAIGRSFYESVLPPGSVHLGWCSYAAVWLSRLPAFIPGHFVSFRGTEAVRAEFARQGALDWEAFLSLRARELRPGGRLIVVLPALDDDGLSGFENIMDHANAVLGEMVTDGAIAAEERARMALMAYPRRKAGLLAPFSPNGYFRHLTVEDFEMSSLPDAAWNDYQRDGNKEALATKQALFFRSVFMPSLASALTRVRAGDAEAFRVFGDRLEVGLKRRVASQPAAMHSLVQTIVLAKRA